MNLDDDCRSIDGVGEQLAKALARLGLTTLRDLLEQLPRRWQDFSKLSPINQAKTGPLTIRGKIKQIKGRYVRRGLHISDAIVSDEGGSLAVVWFNQPYRLKQLSGGGEYFLSGDYGFSGRHFQLRNPAIEPVSSLPVQTARILPVYPLTRGLSSAQMRRLMTKLKPWFDQLEEPLPKRLLKSAKLDDYPSLLRQLHFPETSHQLESARQQLSLRQLFVIALAAELLKQELGSQTATQIPIASDYLKQAVGQLPFKLTDDQRRLTYQVVKEMDSTQPMNRLIQGDVGSGKTIIALLAAINAVEAGVQVALMAPTALLASQHYQSAQQLLGKLIELDSCQLLTAQTKPKSAVYQQLARGQIKLVIGTQALLQQKLKFANLGLVIVDEQHRFGVEQRQSLTTKAKLTPHVLSLTATPIPRSLQLTMFRELAVSSLKQKPPARKPITTEIVSLAQRRDLFKQILSCLSAKHQVYIVCPAIDSDEVSDPVQAASQLVATLQPELKYALLHGRQKAEQRQQLLAAFARGEYPLLITTRVIEAGIDVPSANTIVIMSPERFGLAQLHQLRGRVGRGDIAGHCYLAQADNQPASARLKALVDSDDGFYLSELDLETRGPGQIYGTKQSGPLSKLSQLDFASEHTRQLAVKLAQQFVSSKADLLEYPRLQTAVASVWQITSLN